MRTILDPFYRCVEQYPERLLYAFLDRQGDTIESYTYAEFLQRTKEIAAHIARVGNMEHGARMILLYPPGLEMICVFFACVRLGLIPVPVYPPTGRGFQGALAKLNFIAKDCSASAVLTERSFFWSIKLSQARNQGTAFSSRRSPLTKMEWIVSNEAEKNVSTTVLEAHSDILFLQYTSGSTSNPKGVIVTHENLLQNCDAVVDHQPVGVSWLPQYHDMGLIGYYLFFALKGGTTYGFSPLDFIQRPTLWLETISRVRGTATSAPNFAYEYCLLRTEKLPPESFENLDLSSLCFLMTAAEPVRAQVYRDFIARFEPYGLDPDSFFSAYGLAEYTLAVSNYGRTVQAFDAERLTENEAVAVPSPTGDRQTRSLVSCGKPLGSTEVKIVDIKDGFKELPEGAVGEIWINGPSKCRGYWCRPELSRVTFEAKLQGDGKDSPTWLRSGDLGFRRDGELYICGRTKDLIIVRGLNYYPQDIEMIVEQDPAIRKSCVAAFALDHKGGEQVVVVAELRSDRCLPDADLLNSKLQQALGIGADLFVYIRAKTIPKTSSGKISRHQARERWLGGKLEFVGEARQGEAESAVETTGSNAGAAPLERFGALFHRYGLRGEETGTLGDVGLDSLRIAEFAHDLKAELEAGGNGDLSDSVDLRLLIKISVSELFESLEDVAAAAPRAMLRFKRTVLKLQREHHDQEARMMRADTRLRFEPSELLAQASPQEASRGAILLTGGTGFFGPFLLKSLLEQCEGEIFVLVRAKDPKAGMLRLRAALRTVGGAPGANTLDWERRVRPVCGDLAEANLGLSRTDWQLLSRQVHTIYHNGALVNYLFDYAAMRETNVGGTHEVIRLALSDRVKVLNHISTTFVFGWSVKRTLFETDTNPDMERLDFGYSQSKWVSEQVVLRAMQDGLQARIFRPALLSPSIGGEGDHFDISIRLLAFMLKHRIGTTAKNQVSFFPADLAADNIVAISSLPESLSTTCHVTRDTYATMLDITTILARLTRQSFENFALNDFVPEVIERCQKDDPLFPLLNFLVRSVSNITAMEFKRYDNSNFQRFRGQVTQGKEDPLLEDVVVGILRFMRGHGIVED